MAAGNGGQKMSQYSWFTVYSITQMTAFMTKRCPIKGTPFQITGHSPQLFQSVLFFYLD